MSGVAQFLVVIGGAAAASVGALFMGIVFPQLLEEAARAEAGTTLTNDFSVGTCFNDSEAGYPHVDCDDPHEAEVLRQAQLSRPGRVPGPGGLRVVGGAALLQPVRDATPASGTRSPALTSGISTRVPRDGRRAITR